MKNEQKIQYISTAELAKLLHVSRIAVFKKIQSGKIKAFKIGRNYVIPMEEARGCSFPSTDNVRT